MRPTGLTLLALVVALAGSAAAEVSVRATLDPPQVRVGESADLSVEVDGAQNVAAPAIPPVDGLTIRYVGPETQVSIVNGQTTTSITHRFSVSAARPGTFTIGPLAVDHAGKQYAAGSVTLQALPAGAPAGGGQAGAAGGEQLRLVLSTPRTEVYLHERMPLELRLMVGNVRVSDLHYPTIPGDGFALEKLTEPTQTREQTAEGTFQVVTFRTVLTPLRSGALTVGPASMSLSRVERGRRADPFFGSFFGETARPMDLQSGALELTVLPLPDAGRPADFSGAVGRFEFEVTAAPLSLTAGDPVTVRSIIRGDGYLESVTAPAIPASDALRVYPMQPATSGPAGQPAPNPGEHVFEQVVIPQSAGAVSLPALRFSYFDPTLRSYQTITRPPIALAVQPAARAQATPQIVGGVPARARPETLGRDIVFIKDAPGTLRPLGARRYRSPFFWLAQLLPLAVWTAAALLDRRRRRLSGDVRYARFTRAGRAARQALAGAREALRAGDRAAFYDAVARAVSDYLAAKLDLPPGSVTPDAVAERVQSQRLSPRVVDDVQALLATCEHARFAPSPDAGADMQHTLERAHAIVAALERERRLGRALAAVWLLCVLAHAGWAATGGESPNTIFFHGNALYGEERYPEAAAEYERVLAAGLESGNVYFNLGNAYFKAGDVGRAILAYERARRLIPGDPDLQANLGYARTLGEDPGEDPLYVRLLFPFANRLNTDGLLLTASLCWTALMLLLAAARFVPALERVTFPAILTAAVVVAALVPAAAYRLAVVDLPAYAVVIASHEATVRFEPSATGTVHFQAKPGSVLHVIAEREGWAQVARPDGRRGWIERDTLTPL